MFLKNKILFLSSLFCLRLECSVCGICVCVCGLCEVCAVCVVCAVYCVMLLAHLIQTSCVGAAIWLLRYSVETLFAEVSLEPSLLTGVTVGTERPLCYYCASQCLP